jgi:hypothetical protein
MIQRCRHRPRGLANNDNRSGTMLGHHTAPEGRGDQTHRIDGVHRVTKNVVEICSKPLKWSAQ